MFFPLMDHLYNDTHSKALDVFFFSRWQSEYLFIYSFIFVIFCLFFRENIRLKIPYELSARQTIHKLFQALFLRDGGGMRGRLNINKKKEDKKNLLQCCPKF